MQYTFSQLSSLKAAIMRKIDRELNLANKEGKIQEVLNKYEIVFEEESMPVDTRTMKILVFGALAGNVSDYQLAAKKIGINQNNIEFQNDYDRLTNYDVSRLENSMEYSDIIYGPAPHSQMGRGDYSSFLAKIKSNPAKYPRVIEAKANDKFKITISNFKSSLLNSRYIENLDE